MAEIETDWFIKPGKGFISVSESIADALAKIGISSYESEAHNLSDRKGVVHYGMYKLPFAVVELVRQNKLNFNFRYRIFVRHGGPSNPVDVADFLGRKKKSAIIKKVDPKLDEFKARRNRAG